MFLQLIKKFKLQFSIAGAVLAGVLIVYLFGLVLLSAALESAAGLPLTLGRVNLKLFPIELGLYHIKVKSLKGFKSPHIANIPEIFVSIEPWDLLKGKLHVREVRINIDEIIVERNTQGKVNLNELQKKMAEKQPNPAPLPHLQIDKATLTMTRALYIDYNFTPPVNQVIFLNIYNATLEDVTNPMRVTEQILTITLKKLGMKIVQSQINKAASTMAEGARQTLTNLLTRKPAPAT